MTRSCISSQSQSRPELDLDDGRRELLRNLELDCDGRGQGELLLPLHEDRHRVWGRWVVRRRWTGALGIMIGV